MKKMVLMVAVMMIAAPAMAQVNFTITMSNPGEVVIGYTNSGSPDPRGIAIEVEITGSDATFEVADAFVSQGSEYNCNIDYLYTNGGGVGDGHPLAEPDDPGVYLGSGDKQRLAISLGFLDEAGGNQAAQTAATVVNLVTLKLTQDLDPNAMVTISADTTRGPASGVVGSEVPSTFGPPAYVTFAEPPCFPEEHADFAMWTKVTGYPIMGGATPDSWCGRFQCKGDVSGGFIGKNKDGNRIHVSMADLDVLLLGWQKVETDEDFPTFIAADFDHAHVGKDKVGMRKHVSMADLDVLLLGWQVKDAGGSGFESGVYPCPGDVEPVWE